MVIEQVRTLEFISSKDTIIHNLEGRVKLVAILLIILFTVFSDRLIVPVVLEVFLLIIMYLAKLSFKYSFKRVVLLLPFGGFIIALQPFIHSGNIIWQGPYSWLFITDTGLNWTVLLFARLIVCLTAIVILSSTSPMQEVVQSFRKLGMPRDLAMILAIMVRFLFIFVEELRDIHQSMASRNFDPFNSNISYKWRLKQVGYSIAMMFLKAYEKGENIYLSMASRCFSDNSNLYHAKTIIGKPEYIYLAFIIAIILLLELIVLFYSNDLAYFGISLSL
ncbi:cobalt/nickel transport system permease protein [Methanobrevibacter olleyae]|uniref:Cobalt/nickel transport system permease protein n=1 Tax=Methanobrevibacter olleyae TaxID=294671 RepID=A0A1I4HYY1_METOL|nr:cobalt ECF transporter T component CbiQ [Methanobrevibacter olleyae]SFL47358.1 cobalt/nickel transport system permease protein [Methanobrevibacter olleyae]